MDFNVSPFRAIRSGELKLQQWKKKKPPVFCEGANPLGMVVDFARYMGVTVIPAATIDKFRNDPYYSYCFYVLRSPNYVYDGDLAGAHQKRLVHILKNPDDYNDRDFCEGAHNYLNNFQGFLPGGYKRSGFQDIPPLYTGFRDVFTAIDEVLVEKGGPGKALELRKQMGSGIAAQADFHKYCLDIFNVLVGRGFAPQRLWG